MKSYAIDSIFSYIIQKGYEAKLYKAKAAFDITGHCPLSDLSEYSMTWVKKMAMNGEQLRSIDMPILIIADALPDFDVSDKICFIIGANPKGIYFSALEHFFAEKAASGIAQSAVVQTKDIGKDVFIGEHTYICDSVKIGDRTIIMNNVTIECPTIIGNDCIIGSGCVIGSPGFGYYTDANGAHKKVPDFGGVIIGNDVEIGSNTCIDRGTLDNTVIEDGVKIDNLCHIAHNVHIEKDCLVIAQSMLGGSARIKEKAYIAPGVLVINQAIVGKHSLVGMGSVVIKDVEDDKVVVGVPAKVLKDNV